MGISGVAISAVIAILCVPLSFRLVKSDFLAHLRRSAMMFSKSDFNDILQVALPGSLSPLLTIAVQSHGFVATFGEAALAGYGIGSRIEFLIIPLVFGLGAR